MGVRPLIGKLAHFIQSSLGHTQTPKLYRTTTQFNEPSTGPTSTYTWNSLLRTCLPHHALSLYSHMLRSHTPPNKFTFTFLIKSCLKNSAPHFVKHLHCHLTVFGFASDSFLQTALICLYADAGLIGISRQVFDKMYQRDIVSHTALISAYAGCGMADAARQVFDEMPERNSVSWGAVIAAYSQSGRHTEALVLFQDMRRVANLDLTDATLVSVLTSAAHVGALEEGDWVRRYVVRNRIALTASLGTAFVTLYGKCGSIEDAIQVFDQMPYRDAPAWTAMIWALAMHGRGKRALNLFDEMVELGLTPDHVTFVGVLTACSHAGLLDAGRYHFARMREVYNVAPGLEHYGCMVDMLGRGGSVEEAWKLVQEMPMDADAVVLKSLLSACVGQGYLDYAEWAAKWLIALDAGNASAYVMLANAYASVGKWEDAERMRKMMRNRGVPKAPGQSLIEVDGVSRNFVPGDN